MQEVGTGYVEEMSREWIVMSCWQSHAEQGSCLHSSRSIFVYSAVCVGVVKLALSQTLAASCYTYVVSPQSTVSSMHPSC